MLPQAAFGTSSSDGLALTACSGHPWLAESRSRTWNEIAVEGESATSSRRGELCRARCAKAMRNRTGLAQEQNALAGTGPAGCHTGTIQGHASRQDRRAPAGAKGQGPGHQRGCRCDQAPGPDETRSHEAGSQADRRGQIRGLHPRADRAVLRGVQTKADERDSDQPRGQQGSHAADRDPRSGHEEVLRRAQGGFHAQGAGVSEPDHHFDRRQDSRAGGRRREEGQRDCRARP